MDEYLRGFHDGYKGWQSYITLDPSPDYNQGYLDGENQWWIEFNLRVTYHEE